MWFNELLENNVIGGWSNWSRAEHENIFKFLSFGGYGTKPQKQPLPFQSGHKGILTPSTFVTLHKKKAKGLLFDVEPFYIACTFGLLAIIF